VLLPSLGKARKAAWDVVGMSNMKQVGTASSMYLDEQGTDPRYPQIRFPNNDSGLYFQVGMVAALQPYVSYAGSKPFDCPAAKGLSSVRLPDNIRLLNGAGTIYTLPAQPDSLPGGNPSIDMSGQLPVEQYTEFWFNDSYAPPTPQLAAPIWKFPYGVSGQKVRLIRHPDELVLVTDALDQFPRHGGKAQNGSDNVGKSHIVFGDLRVEAREYIDYQEKPDKYGAPAPFYNWGHLYHRNSGG